MPILVDTNILVRLLEPHRAEYLSCVQMMRHAESRPGDFAICAQVMIEFWSVVTRPTNVGGLGRKPENADDALSHFCKLLPVLPEPSDIAIRWRRLARQYHVSGRTAHDTRLVALMEAQGIQSLLTLNPADFVRYPQIQIVSPQSLSGPA